MSAPVPDEHPTPVTRMLQRVARGEASASEDLLPLIYGELRKLADARLRRLAPGATLEATELVHEAWMKLGAHDAPDFESRAQFFGAAARAMRNILVDQARAKARLKRRAARELEPLSSRIEAPEELARVDLVALDEALERMELEHARPAQVVNLRYFGGLSQDEIAELLGVTARTVDRDWLFAKTWLRRALG